MKKNDWRLSEGLDETQREELGDLTDLVNVLESYTLPAPKREQRARLLAALDLYLPPSNNFFQKNWKHLLRLMRCQWVVFESSFWLSGLFILILGLLMTLLKSSELLPLLLLTLSPLLAAGSVVYLFRPETRTLHELEMLTATHPAEALLARLIMVFGLNVAVTFLLMLVIHLEGTQIVLWRLALAWLGPLLTLTGMALYVTLRWGVLLGAVLPLALWGGLVMLGWREALLRSVEGMTLVSWLRWIIDSSTDMLIGSGVLCLLGLVLLLLAWKTVSGERYTWN